MAEMSGLDEYACPELFWYKAQTYEALGSVRKAILYYKNYGKHSGPTNLDPDREIQRLEKQQQTKHLYGLSWGGIVPVAEIGEADVTLDSAAQAAQASIAFYLRGQYREAIDLFKVLTEQEPAADRAWRYLGHACWYAGEEADAEQAFYTAVRLDPGQATNCFCWGCVQYFKREYALALENFDRAESLGLSAYDYPRFYQFRADMYEKLGDYDAALRAYHAYGDYTAQRIYEDHIKWLRNERGAQVFCPADSVQRPLRRD